MKKISCWAKKHSTKAIGLFTAIEVIRLVMGFWIGSQIGLSLSSIFANIAMMLILAVYFGTVTWFRTHSGQKLAYQTSRRIITVGMMCSLLLAIFAGNQLGNRLLSKPASAELSLNSTGSAQALPVVLRSFELTPRQHINTAPEKTFKPGWARVRCFLLFLLGLVLTYFGIAIACGLACSEMGVLAILVILVVAGIYGAAFYFLLRGLRKKYTPWREMTKEQRRWEWLKYLLITLIAVSVTILLAAIA